MQQSTKYMIAVLLLGGVLLGGTAAAGDSPSEQAVFFVQ